MPARVHPPATPVLTEPARVTEPTEPEPTEPAPRRSARHPRVRLLLDRALSASAGLVALSALAVSAYQAYISREQQKLSAWPYLLQENTGIDGRAWRVQNVGLGPALVRSMCVDVDGQPVRDWGELAMTTLAVDSVALTAQARGFRFVTSTIRRGSVLLPGHTTELVRVSPGAFANTMRGVLNDRRVRLRFCYCSLYGDCWVSDSKTPEPEGTDECPADAGLEFRS